MTMDDYLQQKSRAVVAGMYLKDKEMGFLKYHVQHLVIDDKPVGVFKSIAGREQIEKEIQLHLDEGSDKGWRVVSVSIAHANTTVVGRQLTQSYDVVITWEIPD